MQGFVLPFPVIDTHAHIGHSDVPFSSSLQRDATADRVLEMDERAGVRYSVVVPVKCRDFRDANAWIAAVAALYPDRFCPFARIAPSHRGALAVLQHGIDDLGLRGLKLALSREDFSRRSLHVALEFCAQRDKPVLVCSAAYWTEHVALARRHPRTQFLFGHMGGSFNARAARAYIDLAAEVQNVWLEPSSMAMSPYLEMAARRVPHRLMFGSDAPVNWPRVELEKFFQLNLAPSDLRRVLYGNALEFLQMDRLPAPRRTVDRVDRARLVRDLRRIGLARGDIVMVHSALSSIGYVDGGARTLVEALIESVSPGGTVLFPSNVFRGSMTRFLEGVQHVDLRDYPSRLGATTRAAAEWPGALRSIHPTHPVVGIGPDAAAMLSGHPHSLGPCGVGTPYHEVARRRGKILLIGVTSSCNTTFHTVEEIAAPYIFGQRKLFKVPTIGMDGSKTVVRVKPYVVGLERDFCQAEAPLLRQGALRLGRVGNAVCRIIDSGSLVKWGVREVRKDGEYLALRVSDVPRPQ